MSERAVLLGELAQDSEDQRAADQVVEAADHRQHPRAGRQVELRLGGEGRPDDEPPGEDDEHHGGGGGGGEQLVLHGCRLSSSVFDMHGAGIGLIYRKSKYQISQLLQVFWRVVCFFFLTHALTRSALALTELSFQHLCLYVLQGLATFPASRSQTKYVHL